MKVILLVGPGEVQKRQRALGIRKQCKPESTTILDFKQVGVKDLEMQLVSRSLFDEGPRLVVCENPPDSLDLMKLSCDDQNLTLLLAASNPKTDSPLLQSAKKVGARIYLFESEKEVSAFPFLDALIEGKPQAFVELQKLLVEYGGAYVLTMIYYLLRRNLLPLPPSSFVQNKIKKQRARFKDSGWPKLYEETLKTDYAIKSGLTEEKIALSRLTQQFILGKPWG